MKKRNVGFDVIRIFAILCVLYNHREAFYYYNNVPFGGLRYYLLVSASVISRCGPPIFLMISGILLLDKEESFLTIIKHRLSRILIVMLVISIYAKMFWPLAKDLTVLTIFTSKLNWYLYAYCAYLLMLPILRVISKNITIQLAYYFIWFTVVVYSIQGAFIPLGIGENFTCNLTLFGAAWASNCWHVTLPLCANMLFWIYESKENNFEKKRFIVYLALGSLVACIGAASLMQYDFINNGLENCEQILQHAILLPSCFIVLGIYHLFETIEVESNKVSSFLREVSLATFGVFLVETHTGVSQTIFSKVCVLEGIVGRYMCSIIAIICSFTLLTLVMCILRKVPGLKKVL